MSPTKEKDRERVREITCMPVHSSNTYLIMLRTQLNVHRLAVSSYPFGSLSFFICFFSFLRPSIACTIPPLHRILDVLRRHTTQRKMKPNYNERISRFSCFYHNWQPFLGSFVYHIVSFTANLRTLLTSYVFMWTCHSVCYYLDETQICSWLNTKKNWLIHGMVLLQKPLLTSSISSQSAECLSSRHGPYKQRSKEFEGDDDYW